jgi:hypothetical protein
MVTGFYLLRVWILLHTPSSVSLAHARSRLRAKYMDLIVMVEYNDGERERDANYGYISLGSG